MIEKMLIKKLLDKLNAFIETKAAEHQCEKKDIVIMYYQNEMYYSVPSKKINSTLIDIEKI